MMNYHDKFFRPVNNSLNGETTNETLFHYRQEGSIVFAEYSGGSIAKGQLIGVVAPNGRLDSRYQQVNRDGKIMTGTCISVPEIMPGGKIRLYENWKWTSGDLSAGESIIEEI